MPYLTFSRRTNYSQYTFEQMYKAMKESRVLPLDRDLPYIRTHTVRLDTIKLSDQKFRDIYNGAGTYIHLLNNWQMRTDFAQPDYTQFMIPKRSGGYRTIDAPHENLKALQSAFAFFLQNTCRMQSHDAAFAYVPKRCPKYAVLKHQQNKWFLKLDIKDFFPSMTAPFVRDTLKKLFPLSECWERIPLYNEALQLCFKEEKLPQGSPASPLLSNLCMIPMDLAISNKLRDFDGHNFKYTRYADDLLISAPHDFDWRKVRDAIQSILGDQFLIKDSKTRYASSSGRNWNLGLMLNQEQQITVGHARKERTKAMLYNFMKEGTRTQLTTQELQVLQGEIAYVESIEPDYIAALDMKYRTKLLCPSYKDTIKAILKQRAQPN